MEDRVDVVVVGSGAAGLAAALAAAVAGADTVLLEATSRWGGTTSVSGGVLWVPANHRMAEIGVGDTLDEARAYCRAHTSRREHAMIEAYLRAAPLMARFLEEHAPIRLRPMRHPDTFAESPGGKPAGRHLEIGPVGVEGVCDPAELGWVAPGAARLTNGEVAGMLRAGVRTGGGTARDRSASDQVTMGLGLVAGLLRGCRAAGVTMIPACRVRELLTEAGAVAGVVAEHQGALRRFRARRAVVLAAGGFEHDDRLSSDLLSGPPQLPLAPPVGRGDGVRLAARAGAALAHLGEGWRWPAVGVAGESWGDDAATPRYRMAVTERAFPHVLWVDQTGRRFVDEAAHNCALALGEADPAGLRPRHRRVWAIGDAQFRRRYPAGGVPPGRPAVPPLMEALSLADLGDLLELPAGVLAGTVGRFNALVRAGHDADFRRGESEFERAGGDPGAAHPVLGTVEEPPFFALPVHPGIIGTQGGPRCDAAARVLDWGGAPVPGLLAAGAGAAAVFGPGLIANGLTLGTALTFGWLAGGTAARGRCR